MKLKTFTTLAALAGTTLMAGNAQAGLINMRLDLVDATGGLDTYRLVGEFGAGDRVDALSGTAGNPFALTIGGAGLVNINDLGGGLGNSDRAFGTNDGRDSYFTLGDTNPGNFAPQGGYAPDPFGVIGGQIGTKHLTDGLTLLTGNFSYFVAGGRIVETSDDAVGTDFTFMQITVANGTSVSVAGQINGFDTAVFSQGFLAETAIPSPGALALLGLAGLTGIRRRRRA